MVMRSNIFERVREHIKYDSDLSADIRMSSRLYEDLHLDSLDILTMAGNLEEEFSCDISDEIVANWKTVEDVVNYFEEALHDRR